MNEGAVVAIADDRRLQAAGDETLDEDVACLISEDRRTRKVVELAQRVAQTEASVMITGESGTGKEMFARYIHLRSRRAKGPFVAVNCAAIPGSMLEATLFGYEKGAFTGAYQTHFGKFERAQGGTLLLDEVTEIGLDLQAKLLRVLQEREIERLGGRRPIALDVRILATSNRDLSREVAAGRFRKDLYYRLNVFPLALPPLSERPADILPLAEARIRAHTPPGGRSVTLTQAAREKLLQHCWPGNVRELDNVIQRALILANGSALDAAEICIESALLPESWEPETQATLNVQDSPDLGQDLRIRERELIVEALRVENGNRQAAARRLGISARTLRYKIARLRQMGLGMPVIIGVDAG
jgi:two-component system response regulator FlrC